MKKSLFICVLCTSVPLVAQTLNQDYVAYIEQYKQAAVNQEITHRIPACITLAQGLLESGAGKSELARQANNHFGIKCHKEWTGATYTLDDDSPNECFRKYTTPDESFEDHALFLMRVRYQPLFKLDIRDYKGWARGLKECGYATDAGYAPKLIKLIEDYNLVAITEATLYTDESKLVAQAAQQEETLRKIAEAEENARTDNSKATKPVKTKSTVNKPSGTKSGKDRHKNHQPNIVDEAFATANGTQEPVRQKTEKERKINPAQVGAVDLYIGHVVHRQGAGKYVIADAGDTYRGIAAEFNIELKRILRYNGVNEYQYPKQGEKVWLNRRK